MKQKSDAKRRTKSKLTRADDAETESDSDTELEAVSAPTPVQITDVEQSSNDIGEDIFIDFGHSIAQGIHNERYYLAVVVGGKHFQWNLPTAMRAKLEELVQEFIGITHCKVQRIWCDNEFPSSSAFEAWAEKLSISICPSAEQHYCLILNQKIWHPKQSPMVIS
eukprot:1237352-Rhodomonas_salina.1